MMPETIRRNSRNMLSGLQHYLSDMPLPLFAVMFVLSAVYLLLTKIEAPDLWWHLACGRYLFEHGSYPPNGIFTFSPVSNSTMNSHTWLGDLFFYCIHRFSGGETGLQLFGILVSCIPVWVFTRFAHHRYNTWTLLGSLVIIMGTYQQNLLRNSIFAMMFLPLMVWLWSMAIRNRNFTWLLLYPIILLLWTHMHGYAIIGLCILALFFAGEVIDQIIKKENRNFRFLLVLLVVLACSWKIVHVNWNVNPLSTLRNIQSSLFHDSTLNAVSSKEIVTKQEISNNHKQVDDSTGSQFRNVIHFAKNVFRPFLKGGDSDIVMEYKSPFDSYALLPSRALFLFSLCYLTYLFFALCYDRPGLKASYILPSLASIFLGLGYVRTLAFPFLVAFPLMTAHLPSVLKRLSEDEGSLVYFTRQIMPWLAGVFYLSVLLNFFPTAISHVFYFFGPDSFAETVSVFFSHYKNILFTILCVILVAYIVVSLGIDKPKVGKLYIRIGLLLVYAVFIGWVIYFIPRVDSQENVRRFLVVFAIIPVLYMGVFWLSPEARFQRYFRYNHIIFWLLPLFICTQFALAAHYYYKEKTFYKLTQIFTREPGIGRNSLFRDTLPDYVLNNYRTENLLNDYIMGGYLIWKWYDKKKVFIDSRSINYKEDFYNDYNNNFSFRYIDILGIDKALLNITNDEERYHAYMSQNWTLLTFDISTVLLQKPTKTGLQSTYGIIPTFMGKPEDINLLPTFERHTLGAFISNTLRYMLLFGRLDDAIQWTEKSQRIIEKLPVDIQQGIQQKKEFMGMLERHFGRINDPVIATACRKIEADSRPVSQNIAIGDAYLALNKKNEAAYMYRAAARLNPNDIEFQKKVGELMLTLGFINESIQQYQAVIKLNPSLVDESIKLAYLFAYKKDYVQSEYYLRTALANAPKRVDIYLNLGLVLGAKGATLEAVNIYKQGLSLSPYNVRLKEELNRINSKTK